MNAREQYIQQLKTQLNKLNVKDQTDAIEFYSEYIADAGFTTVKEIVDQLGTPEQLSQEIVSKTDNSQADPANTPLDVENNRRVKKILYTCLVVILILILVPLGLELLGLVIGIIGAVLGLGIMSFSFAAPLFTSDLWAAIFYLGGGILLLGLLIILFALAIWAGKLIVRGCKNLIHYLKTKFKEVA